MACDCKLLSDFLSCCIGRLSHIPQIKWLKQMSGTAVFTGMKERYLTVGGDDGLKVASICIPLPTYRALSVLG